MALYRDDGWGDLYLHGEPTQEQLRPKDVVKDGTKPVRIKDGLSQRLAVQSALAGKTGQAILI